LPERPIRTLTQIGTILDGMIANPQTADAAVLLELGEETLRHWITAHGQEPTHDKREGFRLLALHRQGARDDPGFNACRETCRELVYHYNLLTMEPDHPRTAQRRIMMAMVANHLFLFVSGKLRMQKLGEFCCAARPMRQGEN